MKKISKTLDILKYILPFIWSKKAEIRNLFIYSFCLVILSVFLNLSLPLIFKEIILLLSAGDKIEFQIVMLLFSYGLIWTLSQIMQQMRQILMITPLERSICNFSSDLFDHLHSLPISFHINKKIGSITTAIEKAQQGFPDIFWGIFLFAIPTFLEILIAIFILSYLYGIIYGLILLSVSIVFILFTIFFTNKISTLQIESNKSHSSANQYITDSLINFVNVRYFGNKDFEVSKCISLLKEREKKVIKDFTSMEFVRIGQSIIIGLGLIILTYTAGKQTLNGICNISDFVLINGYIIQFATPLSFMGFVARDVRRGINNLSLVMDIYRLPKEHSETSTFKLESKIEKISFENVGFSYNSKKRILEGFSFNLQYGKILAIVGLTGSGKSTISSLLFKFYKPTTGKILINGANINDIESTSLRNEIGIVPQDISLFNTSIYNNILYSNPTASRKDVEKISNLVGLNTIIKRLPHGYDTLVGERGLKLSGGEKQRIAIARALLRKPSLYIFDEFTSSLDIQTESCIINRIRSIMRSTSTIIIAHRLSNVVNADEIIVLNHGIVVERGKHSDLLKNKSVYFSMWQKQLRSSFDK